MSRSTHRPKKPGKRPGLPRTISDTIPYLQVWENGIIEIREGVFSRSYGIPAVNFKTATSDRQWDLAQGFCDFMSSFDFGVTVEITLYNETVDPESFRKRVFLPYREDRLNPYREEYNRMLEEKMLGAKNNLDTEKVLTVTLEAGDIMEANQRFAQMDVMLSDSMTTMTRHGTSPLSLTQRLDMLNHIMKGDRAVSLSETRQIHGQLCRAFTLENCAAQGITTKEVIAPDSFEFRSNEARVGDRYVRSYYVAAYPTYIKGTILTDFAALPVNLLTSVYFMPEEQGRALKMVKQQNININAESILMRRRAASNGVFGDEAVGMTLTNAKEEAQELMHNMQKDNVRLFSVVFLFTLFADSKEELTRGEEQLMLVGGKNLLTIQPLNFQQEAGFTSSLPLGNNTVPIERLMTSQTVGAILPFDVKELRERRGMYYGLNAVSHNMILYDRARPDRVNYNGCILGMPGAGKSFAAKREMINVLLNTEDEVYVIDPEREYQRLAQAFEGTVVRIATGARVYLNPLDLNTGNRDDKGDPVAVKSDFIEAIVEIMVGGRLGLSAIEKSILNQCVIRIYEPYMTHLRRTGRSQDCAAAPTLTTLYDALCALGRMEAENLALAIERYVKGSMNLFNHPTNVDTNSRLVVYDIKDIGSGLKELGLQIALDNIWNRMIENCARGRRTWIYIDEFYLLMQKESSARYISQIWKRARKWKGAPCCITQNVEDMLKSEEARTVINNCDMVMMLGQSPINRQQLSAMMGLSPDEEKYISTAKPGTGILRVDNECIPMVDDFPKDTNLYRIMTTRPDEVEGEIPGQDAPDSPERRIP